MQNEGNRGTANPQGKAVFQEVSPSGSPYGPWHSVASGIGMPLYVEGPASFADNVTPGKYVRLHFLPSPPTLFPFAYLQFSPLFLISTTLVCAKLRNKIADTFHSP